MVFMVKMKYNVYTIHTDLMNEYKVSSLTKAKKLKEKLENESSCGSCETHIDKIKE